MILDDELPDDMEKTFWKAGYYWGQKLDNLIVSNDKFIDNITTKNEESLSELIVEAGITTKQELAKKLGTNQENWTWGKIHTLKFANPIRQNGFGSSLLGAEEIPKSGSNQTINRGFYNKTNDGLFETISFSTFRMVADLNDSEKLMGILSGGSAARFFHPYYKSQLETWKNNEWIPYWLSKEKRLEHSQHNLILE